METLKKSFFNLLEEEIKSNTEKSFIFLKKMFLHFLPLGKFELLLQGVYELRSEKQDAYLYPIVEYIAKIDSLKRREKLHNAFWEFFLFLQKKDSTLAAALYYDTTFGHLDHSDWKNYQWFLRHEKFSDTHPKLEEEWVQEFILFALYGNNPQVFEEIFTPNFKRQLLAFLTHECKEIIHYDKPRGIYKIPEKQLFFFKFASVALSAVLEMDNENEKSLFFDNYEIDSPELREAVIAIRECVLFLYHYDEDATRTAIKGENFEDDGYIFCRENFESEKIMNIFQNQEWYRKKYGLLLIEFPEE